MKRLGKRGFTLVEIMIVVAIIALIVAIAIPNLLRARINACESSAIGALRSISTAEESYRAHQNPPLYNTLAALGVNPQPAPDGGPAYLDPVIAAGTKNQYVFTATVAPVANLYEYTATPVGTLGPGARTFSVDQTGVIFDVTNNRALDQ